MTWTPSLWHYMVLAMSGDQSVGEVGRTEFLRLSLSPETYMWKQRVSLQWGCDTWKKGLVMGLNGLELINAGNDFKLGSAGKAGTVCYRNNWPFCCLWGWQNPELVKDRETNVMLSKHPNMLSDINVLIGIASSPGRWETLPLCNFKVSESVISSE